MVEGSWSWKEYKVRLTDHITLVAEGMRKIAIEGKNGKLAIIEDVLYVPGMQCNLMSVGQLVRKGYSKRLVLKTPLSMNRTFHTDMKAVKLNS